MNDAPSDLLYGVPAIAEYLNMTPRQVYHLTENGLPHFKIGARVCSRKTLLAKWLDEQTPGNNAGEEPKDNNDEPRR